MSRLNEAGPNSNGIATNDAVYINETLRQRFNSGWFVRFSGIDDSKPRNAANSDVDGFPEEGLYGYDANFYAYWASACGNMLQVNTGQTTGETIFDYQDQLDQILADPVKPHFIFLGGSLNNPGTVGGLDYTSWGDSATERTNIYNELASIIDQIHANGIGVIPILGWPNDTIATDANKRTNYVALTDIMRSLALRKKCFTTVDMGVPALMDGTNYRDTSHDADGVHLTDAGARAFSLEAYNQVKAAVGIQPYYTPGFVDDSNAPYIVSTMPAGASVVPSGWSANDANLTFGAAVSDEYAHEDWINITAGADVETILFKNGVTTNVANGDKLGMIAQVRGDGAAEVSFWFGGGTNSHEIRDVTGVDRFNSRGELVRHVWQFDDTNNSIDLRVYVQPATGSSWSGSLQFTYRVVNFTQMGLDPYND